MKETPMLLLWKIRYYDRADKKFKHRHLYLDTQTLDAVTRAAVELVVESKTGNDRDILKYRHLFVEGDPESLGKGPHAWTTGGAVGPSDYLEDQNGKEISEREHAQIVTGSPTARFIPRGAQPHDIDYMLAEKTPVPTASVVLTADETRLMAIFRRDLREMVRSTFLQHGPATIKFTADNPIFSPQGNPTVETTAKDDEIRSFVMIFRRLYMAGEHDPASFVKIVPIFTKALGNHPLAKWVTGVEQQYQNRLKANPYFPPFVQPGTCTFTTKRLIDVFLYTQYAHQPDEKRQRQFADCLAQLHGKHDVLTFLFLPELSKCADAIRRAGNVIVGWFNSYCEHRGISPDVPESLADKHSGLGVIEKDVDRRARAFEEKAEQLAKAICEQQGQSQGSWRQFLPAARSEEHTSE